MRTNVNIEIAATLQNKALGICLVTVTYARRGAYVFKALESALVECVQYAVVIDNGSAEPVQAGLRKRFGDKVIVERFNSNQGSAPGFKRGMQLAYDSGCELMLLLDDDNQLTAGSLQKLMSARQDLASRYGDNNCMVLAYRPGHQPYEGIGQNNGFLGFHVKEIPKKVLKRLLLWEPAEKLHSVLPYAPYSGLLFHREVIQRHGLPDERFVLYGDDLEFTHRVVAGGGAIQLVREAVLTECETSWNIHEQQKSFVEHLAGSSSDAAIAYSIRNRCYFEAHKRTHNRAIRRVNKWVMQIMLWCVCWCRGRKSRWQLISSAIADGEQGVLGVSRHGSAKLI